MKTDREFPHKPRFPIKLSWKHFCGLIFFPLRAKKSPISLVFVPLRHKGFGFPLELVRLLGPGPFPKDLLHSSLCWGSFQLSKNLPWPKQSNNNRGPDHTLGPSVRVTNAFPRCPASPASGTTISSMPYKSCVLITASTYLLQMQWRGRDVATFPLFLSTKPGKIWLWIFKISKVAKRWESHMLAKSRIRVK